MTTVSDQFDSPCSIAAPCGCDPLWSVPCKWEARGGRAITEAFLRNRGYFAKDVEDAVGIAIINATRWLAEKGLVDEQEFGIKVRKIAQVKVRAISMQRTRREIPSEYLDDYPEQKSHVEQQAGEDAEESIRHRIISSMVLYKKASQKLSKDQRTAVQLRYLDGWEYEGIADFLKTTEVNSRKLVSRGIRKLRELMVSKT